MLQTKAEDIYISVNPKKIKIDTGKYCNGESYRLINYATLQYLSDHTKKILKAEIAKDIPKFCELRRGILILKSGVNKKAENIWDELIKKVESQTNAEPRYSYRLYTGDLTEDLDKTPLLVKTTFLSVRGFLDKAKIGNYSIVEKSSRMIETNEFSRCLLGFFSPLARRGAIAFESKRGIIKCYLIINTYSSSLKECKASQMQNLLNHYLDPGRQYRSKGENFCAVYSPELGEGGVVMGDIAVVFNSHVENPKGFVHPGTSVVQKNSNKWEETKKRIEDYDAEIVYYEDPDVKQKFDMAAVMQEV